MFIWGNERCHRDDKLERAIQTLEASSNQRLFEPSPAKRQTAAMTIMVRSQGFARTCDPDDGAYDSLTSFTGEGSLTGHIPQHVISIL
jgi:hypothetical protein